MKHVTNPQLIDPAISARLQKAMDQLCSAVIMVEAGRSCLAVAEQLESIEAMVAEAKRELINDHIDRFLLDAAQGSRRRSAEMLDEVKALTRFL